MVDGNDIVKDLSIGVYEQASKGVAFGDQVFNFFFRNKHLRKHKSFQQVGSDTSNGDSLTIQPLMHKLLKIPYFNNNLACCNVKILAFGEIKIQS